MEIAHKTYSLPDFIRLPFRAAPVSTVLCLLQVVINALVPSLQAVLTAQFIDTALLIFAGQASASRIGFPLLLIILLLLYQYTAQSLIGLAKTRLTLRLTETYRLAILTKRARLSYEHVENNETWDLITRVGQDPAERLMKGFQCLLQLIALIFYVGSLLAVVGAQVWWTAPLILAFSVPLFALSIRSGKRTYEASKEAAKYTRRAKYLQSVLTSREAAAERHLFGFAPALGRRYEQAFSAAYHINYKTQRKVFIKMKGSGLITVLICILTAAVLIAPLGAGQISIGIFMSFITATFNLAQSISWQLTDIASQLADHREYLRDLTAFAALSETPGALDPAGPPPPAPARIEFKNVSFTYPGTETPILNGLSFTLSAEKHYAFVGANGAGKTTIIKLLTGLYPQYSGEIWIDDRELRTLPPSELKAMFSVVYQDFAKYEVPFAESITLKQRPLRPAVLHDLSLDAVEAALPQGEATPLGRVRAGGVDLSGGEWQRVAIARSLMSQAPVYILDEPTAALDPVAESEVYELFGRISQGHAALLITHRLGAAKLADEILVIDGGRLAEQGSHEALLRRGGLYASMFEAQKGWYT